jgi:hypothetical protein
MCLAYRFASILYPVSNFKLLSKPFFNVIKIGLFSKCDKIPFSIQKGITRLSSYITKYLINLFSIQYLQFWNKSKLSSITIANITYASMLTIIEFGFLFCARRKSIASSEIIILFNNSRLRSNRSLSCFP